MAFDTTVSILYLQQNNIENNFFPSICSLVTHVSHKIYFIFYLFKLNSVSSNGHRPTPRRRTYRTVWLGLTLSKIEINKLNQEAGI